ncbi:MAG: hypothetical protein QM820_52820 [Minicystis sp.]
MTLLAPTRTFIVITLLALAAGPVACSYDWQVGSTSTTGSGGGDTGDAGPPDADAGPADVDSGPNCATLVAALDSARDAAKKCSTVGSTCTTSITDECGCHSYVAQGGSQAANDFAAAVQSVKSAGCSVSCTTCLPDPGGKGTCLYSNGTGPFCLP